MRTYDVVGIGIGPFNLGLAALADPLADVDAVFLDQADGFRWHPGMMLEGATIQVPFLADLVTMADPTSPFSFLAFLKATGRLYPFYVRESFYPLRAEYDQYCRWVAGQLDTLRWGRRVVAVEHDAARDLYVVTAEVTAGDAGTPGARREQYLARHVVLGVGTTPRLPAPLAELARSAAGLPGAGPVVHTADYLPHRDALRASGAVTVVGSGQSAAEVYRDLLEDAGPYRLDWVTRSPRFFPMEYTKLTLEMTSPEYTDHFHGLAPELRDLVGREQRNLYKGISGDLIDDIYDTLYRRTALGREVPTTLLSDTEVVAARTEPADDGGLEHVLTLRHAQLGRTVEHRTRAVVAATGYGAGVPGFLDPVRDRLLLDDRGRFDVTRDYAVSADGRLHTLNGEEHTHGVTAPDLGFGPWRNSVVLAKITGREPYAVERRIAFQQFGLPDGGTAVASSAPATEVAR
ncbi:lysine N6-hydroxylase [Isoptericola sp. CG 20/1183]|uniref:L-lysine N6-monooxygenase MbtG n=1 Tax=Isoptericola halotolerans TaxID=300560 RepID=A0ABX5EHW3_9MICO|nr:MULTISPECIES: SidA/IucD/PvdA family monooxygenase [Isoptericola]PRZ07101.1 lysine N6-hydroxylase [Isoptericola halotolerans]PRZ07227.1 lysine N6-hydroxylase [Isoptericola sp. CG 20/1183]